MSRTKLILTVAFIVTLGAGVMAGFVGAKLPDDRQPRSWLKDQLQLSDRQSDQIKAIWDTTRAGQRDFHEARRGFEKQRTDSVVALLNAEQKTKYEQILQTYSQQVAELDRQHDQAMKSAVEKTRLLLTPEQQKKYDELMEKRKTDHGPGSAGGPPGPGGGHHGGPGNAPAGNGPDGMMDRPPSPPIDTPRPATAE